MFIAANPLQPLIDACQWVLEFWHGAIGDFDGSWGWSIILLTFTVRIAILPLTFKGVKSMQRLQTLQPEMKEIQQRYKDDKQRQQQEIMAFYQREKVNPLGSCLPLLLQIPFFISLFYLLRGDEFQRDLGDDPGFLFIPDLADNATGGVLVALIVLYVLSQLGASLVSMMTVTDKTQRRLFLALPFVFVFFILSFEAGLIVYWITTNLWTVGQQLAVRKLLPPPEPLAAATDGKGTAAQPGASSGRAATSENGGPQKAPPPSPRKKKKRSGRRR